MDNVNPISIKSVVYIFIITLLPILFGVYVVLPYLVEKGIPFFVGYLVCFQTFPFIFIFLYAMFLYKKEGNSFNWESFINRMRLHFNGKIFLASIGLLIAGLAGYFLLQPVTRFLAGKDFFSPPTWFTADIHPLKQGEAGTFMGMKLTGAYWAPVVYLVGWFFNIAGEELLYRGYLLPRMELSFNKYAWLINAVCWWVWHCFWRWQMIALLPIIFLLPFVAQKTKSTVPGIIAHGTMNFAAIIMITVNTF